MVEDIISGIVGRYWHKLYDGRIQCDLCPRLCKLNDGQRGLCFIRARKGDALLLTSYGRSSGFCIDPIEKKPLNHFYPGTSVLSFGTAGCNLTCKFCQNHDISKAKYMDAMQDQASPGMIAKAAQAAGCASVAYTYNDPIIFLEYAVDVAHQCRIRGIKNIAVTAGYISQIAREEFFKEMDAVNIDLKAFSQDFYYKLCTAKLQPILETCKYLKDETDIWFEITTLLIPDENDSNQELEQLCQWVIDNLGNDVPIHFSAFHPDFKMTDKNKTPMNTLLRAYKIAKDAGVNHVYCGNIHHQESDTTYCPNCNEILIARDWYEINKYNLGQDGHCQNCNSKIAGRFTDSNGNWGRKRRRIDMTAFAARINANI